MVGDSPSPEAGARLRGCLRPALRVGCGCLVVLVVIVGVGLLFVPKWAWDIVGIVNLPFAARAERDRLFAEALANGDARRAYGCADERFRRAYTAEQLGAYFRDQPALFDPPRDSVSFGTQTHNEKTIVSTTFESRQREYTIYAAKDGGGLHLLGISLRWIGLSLPRTGRPRQRAPRRVQTGRVRRGNCETGRPNRLSRVTASPPLRSRAVASRTAVGCLGRSGGALAGLTEASDGRLALWSDRPKQPGSNFSGQCESVCLSPSTRERLPLPVASVDPTERA